MLLKQFVLITVVSLFILGCTNSRVVQPLNKHQWQIAASFGGPVLKKENQLAATPLSSVSAAYGVTQNISAFTGVHPGSYVQGIYHADAGYVQELIHPFHNRPGISYSLALNAFRDDKQNTKIYPQFDLNAYWLGIRGRDYYYIGVANWLELDSKKAHGQTQETRWIPAVHTGYSFVQGKYGLTLELKYLAINNNNQDLIVDYLSPSDKGVLGIYLSASRKF